jgi:hypothetical protein
MKKFILGVIVGVIVGGFGTFGGLMFMASRMSEPVELSLPTDPFQSEEELSSFLQEYPYEIGFFAKDMVTDKTVERFADRSVCLASIVKVFCLTELYRQKHEDGLDMEQMIDVPNHGNISLIQAADLMIGQSDNAATQALTEFLGRAKVNHIPSLLGIDSMSDDILPTEATLRQILDKRIFGERNAVEGLPMHGTSRGMATYFELLLNGEVISKSVSEELVAFFLKHPKPFSTHYADKYNFAGKGGNILWTRPPKHYSMMGWSLFVTKQAGEDVVLCVWGEWFPRNMPPDKQSEFLKFVTDSVMSIVAHPKQP